MRAGHVHHDPDIQRLTDAQRALVEQANAVLAADETAVHAYGMVIQLSILIVSFGVLSGYLLLEFLVPLLFKNGQTLGKRYSVWL